MKKIISLIIGLVLAAGLHGQTANTGHAASVGSVNAAPVSPGDVVGPASSTDNTLVRWDGTTGKLVKDSSVTLVGTTFTDVAGTGLSLVAGPSNKDITLMPSGTGAISGVLTSTGLVKYSFNSGVPAAGTVTSGLWWINADGVQNNWACDAYANNFGWTVRRANGTAIAPTAVANGDTLSTWNSVGYDTTNLFNVASAVLRFKAEEAFTSTAHGTSFAIELINFSGGPGPRNTVFKVQPNGKIALAPASASVAAWGVTGAALSQGSATYTDSSSSGTVATAVANSFAVPTFAASSATTFTNAANLYIGGDVAQGTNVTLTNSYGLWNVGKTRLDGAVQLPSSNTAGLQLYNTADQTTNYERLYFQWASNEAIIGFSRAGTGQSRSLAIQHDSSGRRLTISNSLTAWAFVNPGPSVGGFVGYSFSLGSPMTNTSGINTVLSITPSYNQTSGTAANTDLLINRTQTAVGIGAQLLWDAQVGSVSQGSLTNAGRLSVNVFVGAGIQALSGAGAANVTTATTLLTSTGSLQAISLADGVPGQTKTIIHAVDGGSSVLTPTTKTGYTTITFTNAGESVTLQFHATIGWIVVGIFGAISA